MSARVTLPFGVCLRSSPLIRVQWPAARRASSAQSLLTACACAAAQSGTACARPPFRTRVGPHACLILFLLFAHAYQEAAFQAMARLAQFLLGFTVQP
eukprot:4029215-Pleurochrysis_carterae.AAC.4